MKKILIVDDEKTICVSLSAWLDDLGYISQWASSFEEGKKKFDKFKPHVILLDVRLGDRNGIDFLKEVKDKDTCVEIIMMTAYTKLSDAVKAVKNGAFNYVAKPLDFDEMELMISKAFGQIKLKNKLELLEIEKEGKLNKIIYKSGVMEEVMNKIKVVAENDGVTVLVTGETGTGKELIAQAIHDSSNRKDSPMVKINCGALPDQLIESELFGYEKNAFTGANSRKKGLLELANEGTIFLDEIGETKPDFQTKLLRVLEEKKFRRVGGLEDIKVDIRIIAATNKNLRKMIKENKFREDLFYRLNVFPIVIPPLRNRKGDIKLLIDYFIKKYNNDFNKNVSGVSEDAKRFLVNYRWPGNVRELRNTIERILIMKNKGFIEIEDIPTVENIKPNFSDFQNEDMDLVTQKKDIKINLEEELSKIEMNHIENALKKTNMNFTKAAEILGISRFALKRKYEKYF